MPNIAFKSSSYCDEMRSIDLKLAETLKLRFQNIINLHKEINNNYNLMFAELQSYIPDRSNSLSTALAELIKQLSEKENEKYMAVYSSTVFKTGRHYNPLLEKFSYRS